MTVPQAGAGARGPEGRAPGALGPWVMGRDKREGRRHQVGRYRGSWSAGGREQAADLCCGGGGCATAHSPPTPGVGGPDSHFYLWPFHPGSIHMARALGQGAR